MHTYIHAYIHTHLNPSSQGRPIKAVTIELTTFMKVRQGDWQMVKCHGHGHDYHIKISTYTRTYRHVYDNPVALIAFEYIYPIWRFMCDVVHRHVSARHAIQACTFGLPLFTLLFPKNKSSVMITVAKCTYERSSGSCVILGVRSWLCSTSRAKCTIPDGMAWQQHCAFIHIVICVGVKWHYKHVFWRLILFI